MTLSLIKSPAAVNLVGNDILFKIHTDNMYSTSGDRAVLKVTWESGDANGDSFTLSWGSKSVTFTCATTPDDSGLQYPAYISGGLPAWMFILVYVFQTNYDLSNDFRISYEDDDALIKFTARENGTDYSLTITLPESNPSNIDEIENTAGVDAAARDFYQILARIRYDEFNYGWNPYFSGLEDRLTPDDDGYVKFRIQEYLKGLLTSDFVYPENSEEKVIQKEKFITKFFIEYAETYDNVVYRLTSTEATPTYAMAGKIDVLHEVTLAALGLTFFDELTELKMFLTWHPLEKTIGTRQPEKLYYLYTGSRQVVFFCANVTYTTGVTSRKILKTATIDQYTVWEICCAYDVLDLGSGLPVEKFTVFVTNADGDVISEVRTFYIDNEYHEYEHVFLFKNSLAAFETFRTTGVFEQENEFEHTMVEAFREEGELVWSQEVNMESFMEETFKANSGWITKDVLKWTNDFIMSTERYVLEDFRLYEIVVTSKKVFQSKDDEQLYYIEFEYKKAMKAAYSGIAPDPILDETADEIEDENSEFIYG